MKPNEESKRIIARIEDGLAELETDAEKLELLHSWGVWLLKRVSLTDPFYGDACDFVAQVLGFTYNKLKNKENE